MKRNGFTIQELLLVLFVVGLIVGLYAPVKKLIVTDKKVDLILMEAEALNIQIALSAYRQKEGNYPALTSVDETKIGAKTKAIIEGELSTRGLDPSLYTSLLPVMKTIDEAAITLTIKKGSNLTKQLNNYFFIDETSAITGYNNELKGFVFTYKADKDQNGNWYSGGFKLIATTIDPNAKTDGLLAGVVGSTSTIVDPEDVTDRDLETFANFGDYNTSITWDHLTGVSIDKVYFKGALTNGTSTFTFLDGVGNELYVGNLSDLNNEDYTRITRVDGVYAVKIAHSDLTWGMTIEVNEFDVYEHIPDTTPPANVTNLTGTHTDDTASFTWTNPSDADFDHVNIYEGGMLVGSSGDTMYDATGLTPGGSYTYTFKAVDFNGNESSGVSLSFTTDTTDTIAPGDVTNVISNPDSATAISLSWVNPSDLDVVGIDIIRDGSYLTRVTGTAFTDTGLAMNTTYTYTLKAVDNMENKSGGISKSEKTLNDTTAPGEVSSLKVQHSDTWAELSWINPSDSDFSHVELYKDGVFIATTTNTSYLDTSLIASTSYTYTLKTVDTVGNVSTGINLSFTTYATGTYAYDVTNLTDSSQTETSITLSWTNPTDAEFEHVDIYLDDGTLVASGITGTSYTHSGLNSGTYNYRVVSVTAKVKGTRKESAGVSLKASTAFPEPILQ